MADLFQALCLGLTGAAILLGIYSAMESNWPSAYVQVTTTEGQLGRFSLLFFLAFRMLPPFVAMGAVMVSAERLDLNALLVGFVGIAAYSVYVMTHRLRSAKGRRRRGTLLLVTFVGLVMTGVACFLAFCLRRMMAPYVPDVKELLVSLWTAAFCAVLYYFTKRVLDKEPDAVRLEGRVRRDIGEDAWEYVEKASGGQSIAHIRAILMAEAVQRPRWFRRIERVLQWPRGRWLCQEGTTGLAQMPSLKPLSDNESIDRLCGDIASWERGTGKHLEHDFEDYLRFRNPDDVFVESSLEYLTQLEPAKEEPESAASENLILEAELEGVGGVLDYRIKECVEAIDLVVECRYLIHSFGAALSGRQESDGVGGEDALHKATERDRQGAKAVSKIMKLMKGLDRASKRVGALGSTLTQEVLLQILGIVESYFVVNSERMSNGDLRFIADEFNSMLGEYQDAESRLVVAVRQEILVDV